MGQSLRKCANRCYPTGGGDRAVVSGCGVSGKTVLKTIRGPMGLKRLKKSLKSGVIW